VTLAPRPRRASASTSRSATPPWQWVSLAAAEPGTPLHVILGFLDWRYRPACGARVGWALPFMSATHTVAHQLRVPQVQSR
jgi:hypothetical protein